jgi:hypothetical protein
MAKLEELLDASREHDDELGHSYHDAEEVGKKLA